MKHLSEYIEDLSKTCYEAGEAIMSVYGGSDLGVQIKDDQSPVTAADQAADKIIRNHLQRIADYPILSEESGLVSYEERKNYSRYWLVDPLDGTKEFIKRNGEFTVNIALIEGQKPILGVVYAPVSGDLYYGGEEVKPMLITRTGESESLTTNSITMRDKGLRVNISRSHLRPSTKEWIDSLQDPVVYRKGSSLKMVLIANNQADLYPKMGPTMEWDTAAADAVLQAAGGQILQLSNGDPLLYNKPNLTNPHFLASAKVIS